MAEYLDQSQLFFDRKAHKGHTKMAHAHYHNQHELYFLVQGKTKYFVGNEIFLLEPGDLLFVPKHIFHKTDNLDSTNVQRLLISFDEEDIGPQGESFLQGLKKDKLVRIPEEFQYRLQEVLHHLEEEQLQQQPHYRQMQRLYLQQLLILISRLQSRHINTHKNPRILLIQSVAKYISESPDRDLSLSALAKQFAISEGNLSRQFKSVTGVSLSEYVNICRITAAEKLLLQGEKSITAVALRCGFNDSNYFAAVFKKLKGITPKKYALQNRKH